MKPDNRLLDAYLDGEASDEEQERLAEWLREDPTNVRQFVKRSFDSRAVHDLMAATEKVRELGRPGGTGAQRRRTPRPRRPSHTRGWKPAATVAAFTIAASVLVALSLRSGDTGTPGLRATGDYTVVGGGELTRGSRVASGAKGATIELGGYCKVVMDPRSEIHVRGTDRSEAVRLERGSVACEVTPATGNFEVETDVGLVSVTGTKFTVKLLDAEGETDMPKRMLVKVIVGSVLVSGLHGELAIAAGSMAVVGGRGTGIVSNIKVVSDKVEDVSSIEAWKKSFIKPGMSDREKGIAVWETVVKFRHQEPPPNEFLQASENVHDPIKTFNVYGYGMCCCASCNIEALARAAGLKARGRAINRHSVPEVYWDGDWHLLDASLICYFLDEGGDVASVDEIIAGIAKWHAANPGFKGNDKKLVAFMRGNGWRKGPKVLATSKFYGPNGWLPAATHGWYSTMAEYDGSTKFTYEYGYSQGYRVNVRLREGEKLVRNWFHKGLHVNMTDGGAPGCMNEKIGQGQLRYAPQYGDIAPGRVGNGERVYEVPLTNGRYRAGALLVENLRDTARGITTTKRDAPGILQFRMPSSYVYLSGKIIGTATVGRGGAVRVRLSRNNGLDWKDVATIDASGPIDVDLKPQVFGLYDYQVRFELTGRRTGLGALEIRHDIQHSQRALPALGAGRNTITFSAEGADIGTVTVEGCVKPGTKRGQRLIEEFKPTYNGAKMTPHGIRTDGGSGAVTLPIETPGDMVALRFGAHYRARDKRDGWDYEVSFDNGKSWRKVGRAAGPFAGNCEYVTVSRVPRRTRKALIRFSGQQRNTTVLFDIRIDADYREPAGAFRPVTVTYEWEEGGAARRNVHVARRPSETYTIKCGTKPIMKTITIELAE